MTRAARRVHPAPHDASVPPSAVAPGPGPAVEVCGLVKRFGEVTALDGIDLTVHPGRVLGLLGPNGAGKTTLVRILTTLLRPDAGTARVAGFDVVTDPAAVRRRIGLSGQFAAVDDYLTGFENLTMVGRLYRLRRGTARLRARELLDRFALDPVADRPTRTYSGGMRRRLDLACALVAEAPVLVLDEPTTGLDPRSRYELWDVIRKLVGHGAALVLTTQYLEEADTLADEIVLVDDGTVIARGAPDLLKKQVGGERLEITPSDPGELGRITGLVAPFAAGAPVVDERRRSLIVPTADGTRALRDALGLLDDSGIRIDDAAVRRPTLDDVFLSMTGRPRAAAGERR